MAYGVKLKVSGSLACFTRPEMKAERVTYDVITPSAARGILESIYWKPQIRWCIDRIQVLNPIAFTNLRRNEVSKRAAVRNFKRITPDKMPQINVEEERCQRASLLLTDVAYIIEAHYQIIQANGDHPAKHREMFTRRVRRGQCFQQPYLGCREFPARFEAVDGPVQSHPSLAGSRDLGFMLHDIDFGNQSQARFFRATMTNGVIAVPSWSSGEVVG